MIGTLVVIAAAYWQWGRTPPLVIPTSTGPAPTAVPKRVQASPRAGSGQIRKPASAAAASADPSMPQALKLAEMEQVPDEPNVGRNPFRFGVPPPPPPPPYVAPPPPPPPQPPPPPPAPQVPLKLTTIITDPVQPGRLRAYLTDPKTGLTLEGVEGQVIDGRYKLLKVGTQSVVIAFVDGTGQRTLTIGGTTGG
jgi:hypothetical protein